MSPTHPTAVFIIALLAGGCAEPDERDMGTGSGVSFSTGMATTMGTGGSTGDTASGGSSGGGGNWSTGSTTSTASATTDGGSTGGDTTGVAGCEDADILCEDFEAGLPSGAPWLEAQCFDNNYQADATPSAGIDGSTGFVTSGVSTSTSQCVLHYDLAGVDDFWVRAWIKIGGPDPDLQHEVTFFELGEQSAANDPELRIGYRGDSSCPNNNLAYQGFEIAATAGPGGEYTGCTGNKPVANEWYCLETHVDQTGGSIVAHLYVDGVKQDTLVHSVPQPDILGSFKANFLKVGMQSYSGVFDELAIDDVSVSTTQIGCPTK
jgi:hypothetical protein